MLRGSRVPVRAGTRSSSGDAEDRCKKTLGKHHGIREVEGVNRGDLDLKMKAPKPPGADYMRNSESTQVDQFSLDFSETRVLPCQKI